MDEELRILQEAMMIKDRLRLLAELQATYWEELQSRGFDASISEQLMMEWSRHAYAMTFRALPVPSVDQELWDLLGPETPEEGAQPQAPPRQGADPSRVPPGEPWLQLVQELDGEDADDEPDERAA